MVTASRVAAVSRSGFWFSSSARTPNFATCSSSAASVPEDAPSYIWTSSSQT